jgi:hypothetical protein
VVNTERQESRIGHGGWLMLELVAATAIMATALMTVAGSVAYQNRACRRQYERAVAMEIVDGEMECLAAGEWKAYDTGRHVYSVRSDAAKNLPDGQFILTVTEDHLCLEWMPMSPAVVATITREVAIR